jgi:hypothetical protein
MLLPLLTETAAAAARHRSTTQLQLPSKSGVHYECAHA